MLGLTRWYDPYITHFAQADTIVPGGVQGLDRYAYVNNNPIRYTDPSGHKCAPEDECDTPHGDKSNVPLTHTGDMVIVNGKVTYRRMGGAELYQLYLEYKNACGQRDYWWCTNGFGLKEFIGMYWLFESNANSDIAKILATVAAQNLYVGGYNPASCSGDACENAALNFIAANIDGSSGLLAGPDNKSVQNYAIFNPGLGDKDAIRKMVSDLGTIATSSNSVASWVRNDGPASWGNYDGWAAALRTAGIEEGSVNGTSSLTVYYYVGDFIVYSINQYAYWESLNTDMTMSK